MINSGHEKEASQEVRQAQAGAVQRGAKASVGGGEEALGFSAVSSLSEGLNDSLNIYDPHYQDLANVLTIEGGFWSEKYRNQGLSIALDIEIPCGMEDIHSAKPIMTKDNRLGRVLALISKAGDADLSNLAGGNQEAMFVQNIKLVETPEGPIPSFIRLYRVGDEPRDFWGGSLYRSITLGIFKVFPLATKREIDLGSFFPGDSGYCFIGEQIKRRTKIVDSVPDDEGRNFWKRLSNSDAEGLVSSLRVFIDADTIKVSILERLEHSPKILDVLLGPLDL